MWPIYIIELMKKVLSILAVGLMLSSLWSCGGEDENEPNNGVPEAPSGNYSPVGVWESGNYFLSLGSDGFCVSYFGEPYIDCGSYNISGDTLITCNNSYYGRPTKYSIKEVTATSLKVGIQYTDMWGDTQSISKTFSKSEKAAAIKDHSLIGKTYTTYLNAQSSYMVTTSFNSYNTGSRSTTMPSATKYPLDMFYIYFDGKIYYQTFKTVIQMPSIGGWQPSYKITVRKVVLQPSGMIDELSDITSSAS